MTQSLSDILTIVEAHNLEMKLWTVAVNTYVSELNNPKLLELLDTTLDSNLHQIPNNKFLVETITNSLYESNLDNFQIVVGKKWETLKHFWQKTLELFVEIATLLKIEFTEIKTLLMNAEFYKAFKRVGANLFTTIKKMADTWSNIFSEAQNFIFKNLKASIIGKSMDEFGVFLNEKLNGPDAPIWKKAIRVIIGAAIVLISYEIWTNMFFIGDWRFDFDFSEAIALMFGTGDFSAVLGSEFIPTLFWFISAIISETVNLTLPCPPSCNWFGKDSSGNNYAAVFVTGYILATNGSLKKFKNSTIGSKIKNYLTKIPRVSNTISYSGINKTKIAARAGLLKAIG